MSIYVTVLGHEIPSCPDDWPYDALFFAGQPDGNCGVSIPRLSVEAGGAELTAGSAARLFFGGDPDETWDIYDGRCYGI